MRDRSLETINIAYKRPEDLKKIRVVTFLKDTPMSVRSNNVRNGFSTQSTISPPKSNHWIK
jgi:hypothetical protein